MGTYKYYTNSSRVLLPAADTLLIFAAFKIAGYQLQNNWPLPSDWNFEGYHTLMFIIFALLWWILSGQQVNMYRTDKLISYPEKLMKLIKGFLTHALIMLIGVAVLKLNWLFPRYLATVYALAVTAVITGRLLITFARRTYLQYIAQPSNRFIIVGASESGQELQRFLTTQDPVGNQFLGYFTDGKVAKDLQHLVRGKVQDLKTFCQQEQINEIYFALPLDQHQLIEDISRFADDHFVSFRIIPDFQGTMRKAVNVYYYDHLPILTVRQAPLGFKANQVPKRAFDVFFSLLVIVGLFPLIMPLLALIIKLDSPGPIFFKQLRPGKHNKLFPCYKLRTMRTDHGRQELQASKSDPRVTRVGAFLRKTSLDELPQFFNVLFGHMSVVGPRPNMISQLEEYSKHIRTYPLRHAVTPGITGYAQVNGYRGETRMDGAMEKRVEYDLKYVENWSFGLDMKIIGQTVWNMAKGEKNAY